MADPIRPNDPRRNDGTVPTHIHVEKTKEMNWLPWLLLALGVLALLWFLLRPKHDVVQTTTTTTQTEAATAPVATTSGTASDTPAYMVGGLGDFLKGSDAAPRTFQFDKLHFDTAKADIRAEDRPALNETATVLKQYGTAKIRIAGYADARGTAAANQQLGQARAEAVKAALVAAGIDAARIAAVSGGESDPAAMNGTAQGQAENRRTELVVVSR